jgi:hypothetical protein
MYAGTFTPEEFEAVLEACRGVAVGTFPLPRLQRHLVDRLKGAEPELAAKVAALYGDRLLRLAEELTQAQKAERELGGDGGAADAPK